MKTTMTKKLGTLALASFLSVTLLSSTAFAANCPTTVGLQNNTYKIVKVNYNKNMPLWLQKLLSKYKVTPVPQKPVPTPAPEQPVTEPTPAPEQPVTEPAPAPEQPVTEPAPTPEQPVTEPAPTPEQPVTEPAPTPEQPVTEPAPAPQQPVTEPAPVPEKPAPVVGLTADEQKMLDLVNAERKANGLKPLQIDMEIVKVARLKSKDMIDKNYFSHTSPTYGSPFDMMKQFGISYNYAGENLAGNWSVESAHKSLMESPGHRANILNPNFTHIGIGILDGGPYGKMFTQMFVGR